MNFSSIIVFCIIQIIVLTGVLTIKRFRNYVNLLLGAIMITILLKFIFFYLYFDGFFTEYPLLVYINRFLQILPPPILWFYSSAIISGSIIFRRRMLLHTIPLVAVLILLVPLFVKTIAPESIAFSLDNFNRWFGLIAAEAGGLLFIIYSRFIFQKLKAFYGANATLWQCLMDFTHQHLTLLKVLSVMMNVYGIIMISGGFIAFYDDTIPTLFDYLDTGFLIILSYIMIFILVSIPKVIHYKYSSLPKSDRLLKYEKSNLSRNEALEYMNDMNKWMESDKPFLNSNLSLADFTEKLHLPGHIISEVLNGLLKQNFYDYVNNYRIEEFKKLASEKSKHKETNLSLAFESGFNSKTTFNTAFKKFTNQTPTEFRSEIKN